MESIKKWLNTWGTFVATFIVAVAGLIYGAFRKKAPAGPAGPSDKQKDIEKETQQKSHELEAQIAEEVNKTILIRDQTLEKLTEEEKKKVEELKGDPKAVNEYLLEVGKRQRGG
jgi:hypothetical protein